VAVPRPRSAPHPCWFPFRAAADTIGCGAPGGPGPTGPARRLLGLRIDPNRADPITLETLPNIGPVRARAIVAERCRKPFHALDDLRRVPGIGAKALEALRPHVAIATRLAACDATSLRSETAPPEHAKENR